MRRRNAWLSAPAALGPITGRADGHRVLRCWPGRLRRASIPAPMAAATASRPLAPRHRDHAAARPTITPGVDRGPRTGPVALGPNPGARIPFGLPLRPRSSGH